MVFRGEDTALLVEELPLVRNYVGVAGEKHEL